MNLEIELTIGEINKDNEILIKDKIEKAKIESVVWAN